MKYRNQFMKYTLHAQSMPDGEPAGGGGGESADTPPAEPAAPANDQPTGQPPTSEGDKGYWPGDWQTRVSKGDDKLMNVAKRYASPEAAFEALVAAQNRIRSGELKSALPKNAKPEELAAWRKDNGIPESPDKYDLKFDSDLVIGDEDKDAVSRFLESAHGKNYTPEQAKAAIEWHYNEQERQAEERHALDDENRTQALDALNVEWGPNFRRNVNMVEGLLSKFPESVRDSLKSSRLADGTAIFNHPDVLRGFAALALEINPAGTIVPSGHGDPVQGVNEEIGKIENTMRTNRTAYNKDEAMQARYRELLAAREKLNKRG